MSIQDVRDRAASQRLLGEIEEARQVVESLGGAGMAPAEERDLDHINLILDQMRDREVERMDPTKRIAAAINPLPAFSTITAVRSALADMEFMKVRSIGGIGYLADCEEAVSMNMRFTIEGSDEGWSLFVTPDTIKAVSAIAEEKIIYRVDGLPSQDAAIEAAEDFRAQSIARLLNVPAIKEPDWTLLIQPAGRDGMVGHNAPHIAVWLAKDKAGEPAELVHSSYPHQRPSASVPELIKDVETWADGFRTAMAKTMPHTKVLIRQASMEALMAPEDRMMALVGVKANSGFDTPTLGGAESIVDGTFEVPAYRLLSLVSDDWQPERYMLDECFSGKDRELCEIVEDQSNTRVFHEGVGYEATVHITPELETYLAARNAAGRDLSQDKPAQNAKDTSFYLSRKNLTLGEVEDLAQHLERNGVHPAMIDIDNSRMAGKAINVECWSALDLADCARAIEAFYKPSQPVQKAAIDASQTVEGYERLRSMSSGHLRDLVSGSEGWLDEAEAVRKAIVALGATEFGHDNLFIADQPQADAVLRQTVDKAVQAVDQAVGVVKGHRDAVLEVVSEQPPKARAYSSSPSP